MRFVVLVEGKTEKKSLKSFLKKWLDVNGLAGVGIDIFSHRSASTLFSDAPSRARDLLAAPDGKDIIAVFSLIDLYGAGIYPSDRTTVADRYEWGKREMESRADNVRYRHFFAVHETEAWLFSQPECLPTKVARSLLRHSGAPEQVNFDHPPSDLLRRQYLKHVKRGYGKTTDGPSLFAKLDPVIACEKCPHLKAMLDEMLQLAKDAGF